MQLTEAALAALLFVAACAQSPAGEYDGYEDGVQKYDAATDSEGGVDARTPATKDSGESPSGEPRDGAAPSGRDAAPTPDAAAPVDAAVMPNMPEGPPAQKDGGAGMADASAPRDAAVEPPPPKQDASTPPPPVDAGPAPNPMTCSAVSAYPTTNACSQCICARCSAQVMPCYASNEANKNTQCRQIQECAEMNRCASTACYCGSGLCLNPEGRCADVIERVVGSDSPLEVQRASNDGAHPLGRANAIGMCAIERCARECGL